jgi:Domain of unknown function DUF11
MKHLLTLILIFFSLNCLIAADLSLEIKVNRHEVEKGDTVTANIFLNNDDKNLVPDCKVQILFGAGIKAILTTASQGKFDAINGIWSLQKSNGLLIIHMVVSEEGPLIFQAEIISSSESDPDSTPNNQKMGEDDLVYDYVSVPVQFCGESIIHLNAEAFDGFTGYQWFLDGLKIVGANTKKVEITKVGRYTCKVNEGLTGNNASFPVIVRQMPKIRLELGKEQQVCAGETLKIKAKPTNGHAPYTYSWENDKGLDLQKSLKANSNVIVNVTVTDSLGCKAKDSVLVKVISCNK